MITRIEDYFSLGCGRCPRFATADCSTRPWAQGLLALRRICLDVGLVEALKWAHPCYMHRGRNVALIGALRGDFRLTFFNPALLKDPAGALVRQGPNTQHPDALRFTDSAQVAAQEGTIRAYLAEAMGYAEAGLKPPKAARAEADLAGEGAPPELSEALAADPALAEAFRRLTPGRQRGYVIRLSAAKRPETRAARVATMRDQLLGGAGAPKR